MFPIHSCQIGTLAFTLLPVPPFGPLRPLISDVMVVPSGLYCGGVALCEGRARGKTMTNTHGERT